VVVSEYALRYAFVLVTRDVDFSELGMMRGFPPKIVWIRRGNYSTSDIEVILRSRAGEITSLETDPAVSIIELYWSTYISRERGAEE
jgi:predicted nuclease of predicted toxin-antitoxin system